MQTFLPSPVFTETAKVLDYRRLGKQRVECLQLLRGSWQHHPAAVMWQGYHSALAFYGLAMCKEWIRRGYVDNITKEIESHIERPIVFPSWLGNEDFHKSHRSNLLRKNPVYYGQFRWEVPVDLPYIWPKP